MVGWHGWKGLAPMLLQHRANTMPLGLVPFLLSEGSAQPAAHLVRPLAPAGALPKGAANLVWGRPPHQLILHIHLPPAPPAAAN